MVNLSAFGTETNLGLGGSFSEQHNRPANCPFIGGFFSSMIDSLIFFDSQ